MLSNIYLFLIHLHLILLLLLLLEKLLLSLSLSMFTLLFLLLFFWFRGSLCPCILHYWFVFGHSNWNIIEWVLAKTFLYWRTAQLFHHWWSLPFGCVGRLRFSQKSYGFLWHWLLFYLFYWLYHFLNRCNFSHILFFKIISRRLTIRSRTITFFTHRHINQFLILCQLLF